MEGPYRLPSHMGGLPWGFDFQMILLSASLHRVWKSIPAMGFVLVIGACFEPHAPPGGEVDHVVGIWITDTIWTVGAADGAQEEIFWRPVGAAFDVHGNVLVLDAGTRTVRAFDSEGTYLYSFGGSGRGPGDLSDPRAIKAAEDGAIYILDADNGLLRFETEESGARFLGSARVTDEGAVPGGFCFLDDQLYLFGRTGPLTQGATRDASEEHIVQALTAEGRRIGSFGQLFGDPPGHLVQQWLSEAGSVACSSRDSVLIAVSHQLPEIRGYRVPGGVLLWTDSLPDFVRVYIQLDPLEGPTGGSFAVGDPGEQGRDRNRTLLEVTEGVFLAQSIRSIRTRREGMDDVEHVVSSCLVASSGRLCETRSQDLPILLSIQEGKAVVMEEALFHTISLVELEIMREGA